MKALGQPTSPAQARFEKHEGQLWSCCGPMHCTVPTPISHAVLLCHHWLAEGRALAHMIAPPLARLAPLIPDILASHSCIGYLHSITSLAASAALLLSPPTACFCSCLLSAFPPAALVPKDPELAGKPAFVLTAGSFWRGGALPCPWQPGHFSAPASGWGSYPGFVPRVSGCPSLLQMSPPMPSQISITPEDLCPLASLSPCLYNDHLMTLPFSHSPSPLHGSW